MSDMSTSKQLTGDILPQTTGQMQTEIPLGAKPTETTSDTNMSNLLQGAAWSLGNLQKLNVTELYSNQRQSMRSWVEFFNTNQFKTPANLKASARRLAFNVEHYQTNYYIVVIILSIYCIITSPSLLFVLMAMGAGCYLVSIKNRENQLSIMGRQIPLTQQYIAVLCLCLPLLLMVGAGSAIFWILGASVFVIFLHALFHQIPNQEAFGVQMEEV